MCTPPVESLITVDRDLYSPLPGTPLYGRGQLWFPLMEKAFCEFMSKVDGWKQATTYQALNQGGDAGDALAARNHPALAVWRA